MNLKFRPINSDEVNDISSWRYEPPYDMYNLDYPPTAADVAYWLDPVHNVHAVLDTAALDTAVLDTAIPDAQLVAFCSFGVDGQVPGGDYSHDAMDIGMGVRPDLTGQGNGYLFAQAACSFAVMTFQPKALRVTIASQNERAMRVWLQNGFSHVQQFVAEKTEKTFVILSKEIGDSSDASTYG